MVNYQIVRSNRRTVSIQISRAGEVTVRCPLRMVDTDVAQFVRSKEGWIEKHLQKLSMQMPIPELSEPELKALKKQAKAKIPLRVAHFAPIVGVEYGRISIRAQRGRWGSCSAKGNLNFNCLLMLAPEAVLDYIVVHELCHIKHHNHSADFWTEVKRVMPDYMLREKWLKENGGTLIAALPENEKTRLK